MLVHSLVAQNDAAESENKIHEDSVARQYGFAGGLVPGVTVYAYLTWPAVERWGLEWLDRGAMSARFASPVYDGETVEIHSHERDGVLHVEARNPKGEVCATATASLPDDPVEPFPAADFPTIALPAPETRPPASEDTLRSVPLGVVERRWHAAKATHYLDLVSDDLSVYRDPPVAHPGWLLRAANAVLSQSVRLGPWIHVSSDCQYHGRVADGDVVTTKARVTDVFERKGHRFVAMDVLMAVEERPVLSVRHTAIYEPRTRDVNQD
jgi:acyl dehydratase